MARDRRDYMDIDILEARKKAKSINHSHKTVKILLSLGAVVFGVALLSIWLNSSREVNPEIILSVLFIVGGIALFTNYGE